MWKCLNNPNNEIRDVVIVTVPWTDSSMPLMAPAVLRPVVEKTGHSCLAIDLNVEIYHWTRQHADQQDLIRFFFDEYISTKTGPILHQMLLSIAQGIVSWQPKYVGLSLFSYVCQHSAKWIAYYIKKLNPDIKILVGGPGCLATFTGPSEYINNMLNQKLFDYHIRGDAEHSLYELLTGNVTFHGINSLKWKELDQDELRALPMPNYSDYDFEIYDKKALPIIGSRGCVRQCKFCDYIANWKKFQWRTAADIFNEMLHQSELYNINTFKFQDSLTNGNQKEFRRLIELLAEHNINNPGNQFTWSGYYIFRDITASSESDWELIHASGATTLMVGIENINEHIRFDIGKKFTNESIDFHFEQAKKYNILLAILNIVGYVNEVEADIDAIKQWLRDHVQYKDILLLQWGATLGIFPNTYLSEHKEELGIKMIGNQPSLWVNESTGSNPALRARWAKEIQTLSKQLGYAVTENLDNHFILETLIND